MTELPSETARQKALDRVDRSEWGRYKFVIALSAVEMIFIWGVAQLADFSNRVHVLIFWSLLSIDGRRSPSSDGQETTGARNKGNNRADGTFLTLATNYRLSSSSSRGTRHLQRSARLAFSARGTKSFATRYLSWQLAHAALSVAAASTIFS